MTNKNLEENVEEAFPTPFEKPKIKCRGYWAVPFMIAGVLALGGIGSCVAHSLSKGHAQKSVSSAGSATYCPKEAEAPVYTEPTTPSPLEIATYNKTTSEIKQEYKGLSSPSSTEKQEYEKPAVTKPTSASVEKTESYSKKDEKTYLKTEAKNNIGDIEKAQAYHDRGLAALQKGDLNQATKEFQEAIKAAPNDAAGSHTNIGNILREKGDLSGAISEYKEAIKINPRGPDTHHNLGSALQQKGDLEGAAKEYAETVKLNPNDSEAHKNLECVLMAIEKR